MSDWRGVLSTVAPWIGAAATGGVPALVGMAAGELTKAFGKDVKPTVDAIGAAISGASPASEYARTQAAASSPGTRCRQSLVPASAQEKPR